jgi:hypothetical protein
VRTASIGATLAFAVLSRLGDTDGEGGKLFFGPAGTAFAANVFLPAVCRFQKFRNSITFSAFVFEHGHSYNFLYYMDL